ncbi:MAG: hypothetical protein VB067_07030 [Christensenellaceae bacterium]|nr:hypothetical protein [Christensenellaceae bacterium]MEA5065072.1 hypothetical protein [Eubacteriales bacterium]MEA5068720.1 hypothetical protein [Christensenellaceae bacterium]
MTIRDCRAEAVKRTQVLMSSGCEDLTATDALPGIGCGANDAGVGLIGPDGGLPW